MKFLKETLFVLLISGSLFSCVGNDEKKEGAKTDEKTLLKTSKAKLEGAWEIMRAEGIAVKSNLGTVYTFEGENMIMGKDGFDNPGKTEITDSTFSFQQGEDGYKFVFDYFFKEDTLVASMQNSNGQLFYMVKK